MSEIGKLMNFEEFRASSDPVLQQREHFRDADAAEEILQPGALQMPGWVQWPDDGIVPVTG